VLANFGSIQTGAYTIFQNEQFVTVKAPDASYNTSDPNIQGDTAAGDVKAVINNTLNSVQSFNGSLPASPAAGLATQGYILPQLMQVRKNEDGLNQAGLPSQIVPNDVAHGADSRTAYNSSISVPAALVTAMNMGDPTGVSSGVSSQYGGSSAASSVSGFNGQIAITASNYLFGNFNANGVRDYDAAVVQSQKAQAALESSGAGISAFTADGGSANSAKVLTGIATLDTTNGQDGTVGQTKGDLIVLQQRWEVRRQRSLFDGRGRQPVRRRQPPHRDRPRHADLHLRSHHRAGRA
jgi:hypothetical protein